MSNPSQKDGSAAMPKKNIMIGYKGAPKTQQQRDYLKLKRIARSEAKKAVQQKVESKSVDLNLTTFSVDASASTSIFDLMQNLSKGYDRSQYSGLQVTPTHIRVKWACAVADATNMLRVCIIQDKAGGVPIGSTVFQSAGSTNSPLSPYDVDFSKTYRVLFDEFYQLQTGTDNQKITGDIRILSKKLRPVNFPTGAGALTPSSGGIYIVFISDSTVAAHPAAQLYSRVYYKDA